MDLDVPLEDGRGVAPAHSVLDAWGRCTLRDGADLARTVRPVPARQGPAGTSQEAIERIQV